MDASTQNFDASGVTHAGKVRERNEDSCLVRNDVGLWAVADGMGGHEAGDLASRTLVESLNSVCKPEAAHDLLQHCESGIRRANRQIVDLGRARGGAIIGTTAAVLLIRNCHYACVWAGDSRIYSINDGGIKQLSRDHTEAEELVASGWVSREEAEQWPRNVITRAVGVTEHLELDIATGETSPGDIFVVCSDGLTRHLSDDDIIECVTGREARNACEAMLELALERGGADNITVIVVRLLPLLASRSRAAGSSTMGVAE